MKKDRILKLVIISLVCFSFVGLELVPVLAQQKTVTLNFMQFGPTPKRRESIDKAVAMFEKKYPNIKIKLDRIGWREGHDKFVNSAIAGNPPDGLVNCGGYTGEFCYMGVIEPLDKYITLDLYRSIPEWYWKIVTYEGHTYGLPPYFSATGLFYNVDHLREVGIDKPPREFKDFLPFVQKLTRDIDGDGKIDRYGYSWPGQQWIAHTAPFWMFVFDKNAGYWKKVDHRRVVAFNTPKAKEGFKFFIDLTNKYKVTPPAEEAVSSHWRNILRAFDMGKLSTYHHLNWLGWQLTRANWSIAPSPKGPEGATWSELSNYAMMITKACKHKKEAWEFIHFLASDEKVIEMRCSIIGQLPVQPKVLAKFAEKGPRWKAMVSCLVDVPKERHRIYPLEPGFETSMDETQSVLEAAFLGKISPEEAVEKWASIMQRDLDEIYLHK
ncbi:sugar ABC transporter substrate-binding protein [Candidatus Aerophobetes bacterium]|nr:sugar ABC transporter substrate-binding protein [Candidatus Aerophobetes bacterium]